MIKENILGHRTRKRKRIKEDKITYYQEYNFEILVLGLFGLGFFLLWEKWNIKSIAWRTVTYAALRITTFLRDISVRAGEIISGVETSDIIGIVLILIALVLVLNRARNRIIDHHPNLSSCPKCDTDLRRTHRKLKHKIQGWFLICRIKRFKCKSCPFDGIAMVKGKK